MMLMTKWLGLALSSANASVTSGPKLRQHSIMLYLRGVAVPRKALSYHHCMKQAYFWTWRAMETVGMKHKPSRKSLNLIGSQKQQSNCKPCLACIRALGIRGLGMNRREGQNNYDGNWYCVGWAGRINSFLLLPAAVVASPNQFQEGCLALCCSTCLPSVCLLRTEEDDPGHIPC